MVISYDNVTNSVITAGSYSVPAFGEIVSHTEIPDLEKLVGLGLVKYTDGQRVSRYLEQNTSTLSISANNSASRVARVGFYDYNDSATATTPISLTAGNWVDLTNNGLGPYTITSFGLDNLSGIWNTSTNRFNFSGLNLGDMLDLRVDIQVTTTSPNQTVDMHLTMGYGSAGQYDLPIVTDQQFKSVGVKNVIRQQTFYIGHEESRDNPAILSIRSDASASVRVNGWYTRVMKL